jgi:hypothetical protein
MRDQPGSAGARHWERVAAEVTVTDSERPVKWNAEELEAADGHYLSACGAAGAAGGQPEPQFMRRLSLVYQLFVSSATCNGNFIGAKPETG